MSFSLKSPIWSLSDNQLFIYQSRVLELRFIIPLGHISINQKRKS